MISITLVQGISAKADLYWHIYDKEKRIGYVYIAQRKDALYESHHSISIFINKAFQGKGYGTLGYKMACKQSRLPKIYAHIAKKNVASQKAALKAGFKDVTKDGDRQFTFVRKIYLTNL